MEAMGSIINRLGAGVNCNVGAKIVEFSDAAAGDGFAPCGAGVEVVVTCPSVLVAVAVDIVLMVPLCLSLSS